jgi:hypothetical protein
LRKLLFVLAVPLVIPVATADEAVWPGSSVGEVSTFATVLRLQIHAEHCSAEIPQLAAQFDSLVHDLDSRIRKISASLLASAEFRDVKDEPVPVEIMDALKHSFHDMEHNVARLDAAACTRTLRDFGATDDASLVTSLTANLTGVQRMSQNIDKARAAQQRPPTPDHP